MNSSLCIPDKVDSAHPVCTYATDERTSSTQTLLPIVKQIAGDDGMAQSKYLSVTSARGYQSCTSFCCILGLVTSVLSFHEVKMLAHDMYFHVKFFRRGSKK